MKETITLTFGAIASLILALFGGWSTALTTLVIFMIVDYGLGLLAAAVFKVSKKTESGGLSSRVGWQGLVRKSLNLTFCLLAVRLDLTLNTGSFIMNTMALGFIANEGLSIIENAGLCGLYIPPIIRKAIDVLIKSSDKPLPIEIEEE